jgi:hypothetical protein
MTLSLRTRSAGCFTSLTSLEESNGSGLTHEKKGTMPSIGSHRMDKTVLFVDDEPSILKKRRLVFETLGYSVLTA